MVTDLLVFELKPLKLLDSINWCKSINLFGALLLYDRTKPELWNRCPGLKFLFYPLACVAVGFWGMFLMT